MSYFNTNNQKVTYNSPALTPQDEPRITILKTRHPNLTLTKRYYLDQGGQIRAEPYSNAQTFKARNVPIRNIHDFFGMLRQVMKMPQQAIIRGINRYVEVQKEEKKKVNFPEHPDGTPWVMIDFDDIPLPEGIDPLSVEAIEHGIRELPEAFQDVTYVYQHSSSAGVEAPDGSLMKSGLNAHVFFWLCRRITGKDLLTWLKHDALERGLYRVKENKGGVPMIQWVFDRSVIDNSVQPHYTAAPILEAAVGCRLSSEQRQGIVEKGRSEVPIPDMSPFDPDDVKRREQSICDQRKRELGWKPAVRQSVSPRGNSLVKRYMRPPAEIEHKGRVCTGYRFADERARDRIILEFEDENTPGSWWVGNRSPDVARRFGDGAEMDLWELSPNALDMVAHDLGWCNPVAIFPQRLDEQGRLPRIDSFVETRASLILAPTGSGKTYQIAQWIKEQPELVIYTAETIALNRQTFDDLRDEGVNVAFYQDTLSHLDLTGVDCVVTTHKSLPRISGLGRCVGRPFKLVIDEVHRAVDWLLQSGNNLYTIEGAIKAAQQTVMLTGTLTDLQSKILSDVLFAALESLSHDTYTIFDFPSVKSNPLELRNEHHFDYFLHKELSDVADAIGRGQQPSRLVAIVPTARMERFRAMVRGLGLEEQAEIVSRPEAHTEEVYNARLSEKPILIASPVFSLGINFTFHPDTLLIGVGQLRWDENSAVQAVNRGNRSDKPCRVVLFTSNTDPNPIVLPPKIQSLQEVQEDLERESTLAGVLEQHLHLDRAALRLIADLEKDTPKALHKLISQDAFQNYHVVDLKSERVDISGDLKDELKGYRAEGRAYYDDLIASFRLHAGDRAGYALDCHNIRFLTRMDALRAVRDDWKNNAEDRSTPRELEARELAAIADLCNLNTRSEMQAVSIMKLRRLMGTALPYLSPQHHQRETHFVVAAEKLGAILPLLDALQAVRSGMDTFGFAAMIRRKKQLREGIRALADNETEFHRLMREYEELRQLKAAYQRSSSEANDKRIQGHCLELAKGFFQAIGITWDKTKGEDGRWRLDMGKPRFTPLLDLDLCQFNVMQLEAACQRWEDHRERLFLRGSEEVPRRLLEDLVWQDQCVRGDSDAGDLVVNAFRELGERDPETCRDCVFFRDLGCLKGFPVDWLRDTPAEGRIDSCSKYRKAPAKLLRHPEWKVGKFLEKLPSPRVQNTSNHEASSAFAKPYR